MRSGYSFYRSDTNDTKNDDNFQISYSSKLGDFNELIIICDQKSVLQVNTDSESNISGIISNEPHRVILQEVLFEKYWNDIADISIKR